MAYNQADPMIKNDRVSSIFWFFIGIYVCIHAYYLSLGRLHKPGPGFIFFLAGALLSILSVLNFVGTLTKKTKDHEGNNLGSPWTGVRWQSNIVVLIVLAVYVALFNFLGFFLSTFLLLLFLFKFLEPTRWWVAILAAILTISISYMVFVFWLQVPFPRGILGR